MRRSPSSDRILATVLFTDIVGSTERAAEIGDRGWRELVARHHALVRAQLKRHRGREVDTAGDGFFATFERPARAIECALDIIEALQPLALTIRAGVHAGELEATGGGKLGGIAVHTAARVLAAARPGEVLVTATVRELVAGSQIEFEDRGSATLKGVPGEWHLFAVVAPAATTTAGGANDDVGAVAASPTQRRLSRTLPLVGLAAVVALLGIAGAVAVPALFAPPVVPGIDTVARVAAGGTAFDRTVSVGRRPTGLAAGGGYLWAISLDDKTVTRIGPDTVSGSGTAVGGSPTGVAFGAGAVWITTGFGLGSGDPGAVVRFSPSSQQSEAAIQVGNGAGAVAFGDNAVWVANGVSDVLLRINPDTNVVERELPVAGRPSALLVTADAVWVGSSLDNVVQRLDPRTYEIQAQIAVSAPTAITAGANAIWVTSEQGDMISRVDPAINQVTTTIEAEGPRGLAVAEDGVWVALGSTGKLVRFDPITETVQQELKVDGFADAVVVDEGGRLWVSVRRP